MTGHDIINFLRRVYCWIPTDNPMRTEIKAMVESLGGKVSELSNTPPKEKKNAE